MQFSTAGEIINDVSIEVGLGGSYTYAPANDPYASTDPNVAQLCQMLKSAGRELTKVRGWGYLRRECTITTVAGVSDYALPADFDSMIEQTGWVRTTMLPMGGPLSPQEWQYLKAQGVGLTLTVSFRPANRTLKIYPDGASAPGSLVLAFEYQSSNWCGGSDTVTGGVIADASYTYPTLDAPTAESDLVWFDNFMVSRLLKLRFLEDKGLDTTAAQKAYDKALDMAASGDSQSPIRSLTGRDFGSLMGERNIPVTGFGS